MLNRIVPQNKRVYVGGHKFVEGDVLPAHVAIRMPDLNEQEVEILADEIEVPKKRTRKKVEVENFG
jgi:hypothetical protein